MPHQLQSLSHRLSRRAHETFVGRSDEMEALRTLLSANGPLVAFLYGLAGIGKTTLLEHFSEDARQNGATVLMIDCRMVEPTPRGLFQELGRMTEESIDEIDSVIKVFSQAGQPLVLALDHYESFLLMDSWLRQTFLPALPDHVRVVIASRQPPVSQWTVSPHWHGLFRSLAIEPLDASSSLALLKSSGLDLDTAAQVSAVAHGHPLALKMAAAASLAHGSVTLRDTAIQDVMQQLTDLFLADVGDATTRQILQSSCVVRRITRSLLRAWFFDGDEAYEALKNLPFVDVWRDGLRIQNAVREAIVQTWRAGDPERFHECRRTAWRQLRDELRIAPTSELWRSTADMLYLIENPAVREAFFPSDQQVCVVEPAHDADLETIREITQKHEGEHAVAVVDAWWSACPEAFRVVRDHHGQVTAFYCMSEIDDTVLSLRTDDPLVASWEQHLKEDPLPEETTGLFLRRWLASDPGESPSPEQAACWLDAKRTYMELRPALSRVYLTVSDLAPYAQAATQLGFRHLPDATVEIGGANYLTAMLDFGPASVDGWITRLVGEELGVREHGPLNLDRRSLIRDGQDIALTPLEFGLAVYLESLKGVTATRDEILDEVWGDIDSSCSSNVVDGVVKTLRRKMGPDAEYLETVRGFGYRWRQG
jgi:hypothetical protein